MPLSATLSASFGANGFDLGASFSGLGDVLGGVSIPPLSFAGDLAGDGLGAIDLADVVGSLGGVLERVGGISAALPDLGTVLGPLHSALQLVQVATTADLGALVDGLESALAPDGFGLAAVTSAAARLGRLPAVHSLLDLAAPLGIDLRAPGALIGGPVGGAVSLVQLAGALLGVDTASRAIDRRAALVVDLVAAERVRALADGVGSGAGARLAALLTGIDPDDPLLVDTVAVPIEEHLGRVRELLGVLVRGMAFADATLADADFEALAAGLTVASVALSGGALAPIGELIATIQRSAAPFLAINIPGLGGDAIWAASAALAGQLQTAIDGVATDVLSSVVEPLIAPVLLPVRAVKHAVDQLESLIRTALDPVRQALDAIDLTAVARALDTLVAPVRDGVTAVSNVVDGARAEIEAAVGAVTDALAPVRQALLDARDVLATPFTAVADAIDALDRAGIEQTATATLTSVADTLGAVPIQPVFDVATGIVNTAADALGLVPKALLPDDLRSALEAACAPVESLDLEPLRAELHTRLSGIIDGFSDTVLDAVQAGFTAVHEFLDSIDPRPHIQQLEQEAFDALTAQLAAIDPSAIISPVQDLVEAARGALAGVDLDAVLQPVNDALDTASHALEAVSPATLLAPIEQALAGARDAVESALHLSTWDDVVTGAETVLAQAIGRLDPAPLFAAVRAQWQHLVEMIRPRPDGARVLPSILEALLAGAPFAINPAGLDEVLRWIRGEHDGAAVVRGRLDRAAAALAGSHAAVEGLDITRLATELDEGHRALVAAVEALPAESLLRDRLSASLAESSPTASLGTLLANVQGVAGSIATAQRAVDAVAPPDRSEVNIVAAGLGTAFRPLQPLVDHARSLLVAIGADPDDLDPRDAIANLLTRVGPDDVIGPFEAAATSLLTRVTTLVHDGLVAPLQRGIADLQSVLGALGIDALAAPLTALHEELLAKVASVRPATVLAGPIAAFTELRALLDGFDPLAPVQAAVDAIRALVTGFADELRPSTLLAPVVDVYERLVGLVGAFDLKALFEPIVASLHTIDGQIDHGMDGVIDALARLRDACESDGGPIPGLDLSVAASVDVSGGLAGAFG